jgi:hypothetical protein
MIRPELSAQPRRGSAFRELVLDHVNDVVGGGVDSLLGVNVRADFGDRVLNGEDGRGRVIDVDVVLFDVVDVHDFRQAFEALLLGADGEGFESVVSMLISVSATVPLAVESPPQEVSATTATMSRLQMTVLATPGRLTGRTDCRPC